ncbi:MAG: SDR family oxidoreductase [Steroidobacteraceae bacterium]
MISATSQGTALVTGASTGIGAVYADRLARRGFDLILVARNASKLQSVADRLAAQTGRSVRVLPADLTQPADLQQVEQVLRENPDIRLLVNNAGFAAVTPLLDSAVERMQDMIAVNVTALTRLTYAVAPAFAARGSGTIINISSIVGIATERLNGVYSASKAYVLAFTQSLQNELAGKGVRIQAVLPGATATDLWQNAGLHHRNLPAGIVMSPEALVDAALAGLDQGETVSIPPLQDAEHWNRYDAARRALSQQFAHAEPAPRYRGASSAAA